MKYLKVFILVVIQCVALSFVANASEDVPISQEEQVEEIMPIPSNDIITGIENYIKETYADAYQSYKVEGWQEVIRDEKNNYLVVHIFYVSGLRHAAMFMLDKDFKVIGVYEQ